MNPLLWKQWRENRGYLIVFGAWMALAVCYTVGYELGHRYRAVVGSFSSSASLYGLVAAIVLAMRVSHGEQTDGTFRFSAALPISLRRMAGIRISAAIATLAIPIVLAACLLSIALATGLVEQAEPRAYLSASLVERDSSPLLTSLEQLASVTGIAIFASIELLLVLSILGCWLRSQSQVGLSGAVLALGLTIASGLFWYANKNPHAQLIYGIFVPQSLVIHWGYGDAHGGYTDHELAQYRWIALALSSAFLALLVRLFTTQYGVIREPSQPRIRRRFHLTHPAILSHLPMRLPGRLPAMIWLELRQSVPLAVFGLMLALLVTVAGVLMVGGHDGNPFTTAVFAELPHSVFFVGTLWAVVVGSALYSADLDPKMGTFWRSRPIPTGMWFWTKFTVGLLAVLLVLDGITIAVSWTAPRLSMTSGMSWAYIGCFPIVHATMYALAVLGTCWFRRPVVGGIAAVLGYMVLTVAITAFPMTHHLEPVNVYNELLSAERAGNLDFTQQGYPLVYGALAISILVTATLSAILARSLQPSGRWFGRRSPACA